MAARFPDVDWYCDECDARLNDQSGFDDDRSTWHRAECDHKSRIAADEIFDPTRSSPTSTRGSFGPEMRGRVSALAGQCHPA